jgi:hypothetical protein
MTIFEEEKGVWSIRRVLAMVLVCAAIMAAVLCIVKMLPWQFVLAVVGVFLLAAIIILFFTTWSDIAKVTAAVRGGVTNASGELSVTAGCEIPDAGGGNA